jgi:hypothetical protein
MRTGFRNAGIYGAEVYRSNDGGATWKKMNVRKSQDCNSTYGVLFSEKYSCHRVNENKLIITGVPIQLSIEGGKNFKTIDKENVHGDHHCRVDRPKT